jgi:hypothetical protein
LLVLPLKRTTLFCCLTEKNDMNKYKINMHALEPRYERKVVAKSNTQDMEVSENGATKIATMLRK